MNGVRASRSPDGGPRRSAGRARRHGALALPPSRSRRPRRRRTHRAGRRARRPRRRQLLARRAGRARRTARRGSPARPTRHASSTTSAPSSTSTAAASRRRASCTERRRQRIREARQSRRPRARGDPQPRRGPLLLPGRQGRPHRAADVPQRVSRRCPRSSRRRSPQFYDVRKAEADRVAGLDVQAWVFEPKDGLRYGHKFWVDTATGLLLKARIQNERDEIVEQFAFTDVAIGAKIDRDMVKPTWPRRRPTGRCAKPAPARSTCATPAGSCARCRPDFRRVVRRLSASCTASANRSRTSSTRTGSSPSRCSSSRRPDAHPTGLRPAGRRQRVRPPAGRRPRHRARRSARRHRPPDRQFGGASLTRRRHSHPSVRFARGQYQ